MEDTVCFVGVGLVLGRRIVDPIQTVAFVHDGIEGYARECGKGSDDGFGESGFPRS